MPIVPKFDTRAEAQGALSPEAPSPENLLMAAAIMHEQGKFQAPQEASLPRANRRKNAALKVVR